MNPSRSSGVTTQPPDWSRGGEERVQAYTWHFLGQRHAPLCVGARACLLTQFVKRLELTNSVPTATIPPAFCGRFGEDVSSDGRCAPLRKLRTHAGCREASHQVRGDVVESAPHKGCHGSGGTPGIMHAHSPAVKTRKGVQEITISNNRDRRVEGEHGAVLPGVRNGG